MSRPLVTVIIAIIIIIIIIAIIMLFSYLSHVGKCLDHGIITRGRSVWRQDRKAFDACVINKFTFVYQYSAVL